MKRALSGAALAALASIFAACTSHHASKPNLDAARALVVQHFVQEPVPPAVRWSRQNSPLGKLWHAYYPGVGVFTLDPTGRLVLSAVLAQPSPQPRFALVPSTLVRDARQFATAHGVGLQDMPLYRRSEHDNGSQTLFTATWRERRGSAWLPALVSVTLTATGVPVSFTHNPTVTPSVDTTPRISATTARRAVAYAAPGKAIVGAPELDVIGPPAQPPRLVWMFTVSAADGRTVPSPVQVTVDAKTGLLVSA